MDVPRALGQNVQGRAEARQQAEVVEGGGVDLQQAGDGGFERDLAFAWIYLEDSRPGSGLGDPYGGVVLMNQRVAEFPDVHVLFAEIQQLGNVFFTDDAALFKGPALELARYNLSDVMAEDRSLGLGYMYYLHQPTSLSLPCREEALQQHHHPKNRNTIRAILPPESRIGT